MLNSSQKKPPPRYLLEYCLLLPYYDDFFYYLLFFVALFKPEHVHVNITMDWIYMTSEGCCCRLVYVCNDIQLNHYDAMQRKGKSCNDNFLTDIDYFSNKSIVIYCM